MAINFPANPVVGQEFSTGTATYTFNGSYWTGVSPITYHGNDYVTYQELRINVKNEGVSVANPPASINFVGAGIDVTSSGRDVTVTVSGITPGIDGSASNEFATYSNAVVFAKSNDWNTLNSSYANDYASYNTLSENIYATLANARANDYSTFHAAIGAANTNDFVTYRAAQSNDWLTLQQAIANAFANDYATLQEIDFTIRKDGNDIQTTPNAINFIGTGVTISAIEDVVNITIADAGSISDSNTYSTYTAALSNDYISYRNILTNASVQFTAIEKVFTGNVVVLGNLVVSGNTTSVSQQTLQVASSNIVLNDGGIDATAVGGGIFIEGTGNTILSKLVYDPAFINKWGLDTKAIAVQPDVSANDYSTLQAAKANDWSSYDNILNSSSHRFSTAKYFDDYIYAEEIVPQAANSYSLGSSTDKWKRLFLQDYLDINSALITSSGTSIVLPVGSKIGSVDIVANDWVTYNRITNNSTYQFTSDKTFVGNVVVEQGLSINGYFVTDNVKIEHSNLILNYGGNQGSASNAKILVHGNFEEILSTIAYDPASSSKWSIDSNAIATTSDIFANDYATYSNLSFVIQESGTTVRASPNVINFTGAGVQVSNNGPVVTVDFSFTGISDSDARANDLVTLRAAQANDYATLNALTVDYVQDGNIIASRPTGIAFVGASLSYSAGSDTLTVDTSLSGVSTARSNDYITYRELSSNTYLTQVAQAANDLVTYQSALSNDLITYRAAQSNDYATLQAARANDWITQNYILNNPSAEFTNNRTFVGNVSVLSNVIIHGNLVVLGNSVFSTTEELYISDNKLILNDGGTNETAEYGGLIVEGTGNVRLGAFQYTADSVTQWRINGGSLEILGTSANDVATFGYFQANDYVTHSASQSNDWTTLNSASANDYTTLQAAQSNDYNTLNAARANDLVTIRAASSNDYLLYSTLNQNIYATYSNLIFTIKDENIDIYTRPQSINFTGNGVLVTNQEANIVVTITGENDRAGQFGWKANDYSTYSTLTANDYATLQQALNNTAEIYRSALANDYTTYRTLSTNAYAYISDNTAPSSTPVGTLWWNSYDGILYIKYADEDGDQWVAASPLTTASVEGVSYAYSTINVTGQTSLTANSFGQLRLIEGENITLVTNAVNGSITISSTGGGGAFHEFMLAGM